MATLVQSELVAELRQLLNEITLSGEEVATDADKETTASSNFSDEDLEDHLNAAARYVAVRVKAEYLPDLVVEVDPLDFTDYSVLRILGSRITVDVSGTEVVATRQTFQGLRKMNARQVVNTADNPVYVFEDYEFQTDPDPGGSTVLIGILRTPGTYPNASTPATEEMDDRFHQSIVQRALFTCLFVLRNTEAANATFKRVQRSLQNFRVPVTKVP